MISIKCGYSILAAKPLILRELRPHMAAIDHLILNVNDIPSSVDFYVNVLGFELEGEDGPFTIVRVSDDFTLQLAPWGTGGNCRVKSSLTLTIVNGPSSP